MSPGLSLDGERIRLEPLTMDHLGALSEIGCMEELWHWTTTRTTTPEAMRAWIETALKAQHEGTAIPFVTVEKSSCKAVGSTRFANIVPEHRRAEIGWTWITPAWQRTFVNTEAKYLMLRHAFETMGWIRVELKTGAKNAKSRAAMLRIGAKEEGILRNHMIQPDGSYRDTVYFSVIDSEWPNVKARLEAMLRGAAV